MDFFHKVYKGRLRFNPALGLFLTLLFGIPRFIFVLGANSGGSYANVSLLFLGMWFAPYLLLNSNGRRFIGLQMPDNRRWWMYAPLLGMLMCLIIYVIGLSLYGRTPDNWFVYIAASYEGAFPSGFGENRFAIFIILALIGTTFSPIGEELLYRGLIHKSFATKLGENKASMVDSAAFALTHLAHYGIVYRFGGWDFQFLPALLWVILMYLSSRVFYVCKSRGGSLYLCIICHAGFNLAMTYLICYYLM